MQGRGRNRRINLRNIRARLLARALCNADGSRKCSDGDAAWLGTKNAAVIDRLFSTAQRLSGVRDEDVEELAGNSEPGPNA